MRPFATNLRVAICRSVASAPPRACAEANNVGPEGTDLRGSGFCRSEPSAPTHAFAQENNVESKATDLRESLTDDMTAQPSSNGQTKSSSRSPKIVFHKDRQVYALNSAKIQP